MANTKAIREKLQAQLRQIQEDLRALDRVEAMEAKLGLHSANGTGSARATMVATVIHPRRVPKSAAKIMKELAMRYPERDWTTVTMDEEIRKAGYRANRSNIGVTLRRLTEDELFKVVKASRSGNIYRWIGSKAVNSGS